MEITIKPYRKNIYPIGGILIKGPSPKKWLLEIQQMRLSLEEVEVYGLPGNTPQSIFGCLLIWNGKVKDLNIGRNSYCQLVSDTLFIPEYAMLFPKISEEEIRSMFHDKKHILHNDFGLVELLEPVNWQELITTPEKIERTILRPEPGVFIPKQIFSFQVKPVLGDDVLKKLLEDSFPKKEEFKDKPLNLFEKVKLQALKQIFRRSDSKSKTNSGEGTANRNADFQVGKTDLGSILETLLGFLGGGMKLVEGMQKNFEDLEKRNQKEIDKLLDLFKTNPQEALKYSIPLDEHGTARGSGEGAFNLSKLWSDFSLFGGGFSGGRGFGGAATIADNQYNQLRAQYFKTAQELEKNKEYSKAAFVYLKLLKENAAAANALENGKLYHEAATVYLKHMNRKDKAAQCYEKGNMFSEAIELYKALNENEKVGDLYTTINRREDAKIYYNKVVANYLQHKQHVKASFIYSKKTGEIDKAQDILLEGWKSHNDAFNCINNYFANIEEGKELDSEINKIYKEYTNDGNKLTFLKAIQYEFDKAKASKELVKDIAYEIISANAKSNPAIVSELHTFNKKDKNLIKDTIRYKLKK